jgi:hypothetical protein
MESSYTLSPYRSSDVDIRSADDVAAEVSIGKTTVKPEWPGRFMPDQIVLRMRRK